MLFIVICRYWNRGKVTWSFKKFSSEKLAILDIIHQLQDDISYAIGINYYPDSYKKLVELEVEKTLRNKKIIWGECNKYEKIRYQIITLESDSVEEFSFGDDENTYDDEITIDEIFEQIDSNNN